MVVGELNENDNKRKIHTNCKKKQRIVHRLIKTEEMMVGDLELK